MFHFLFVKPYHVKTFTPVNKHPVVYFQFGKTSKDSESDYAHSARIRSRHNDVTLWRGTRPVPLIDKWMTMWFTGRLWEQLHHLINCCLKWCCKYLLTTFSDSNIDLRGIEWDTGTLKSKGQRFHSVCYVSELRSTTT